MEINKRSKVSSTHSNSIRPTRHFPKHKIYQNVNILRKIRKNRPPYCLLLLSAPQSSRSGSAVKDTRWPPTGRKEIKNVHLVRRLLIQVLLLRRKKKLPW